MDKDTLIAAWQSAGTVRHNTPDLQSMIREKNHPVLRDIRRQLLIETIFFSLLLIVYYDFFDGDRKPLYANILLAGSVVLLIVHNIIGYLFIRRPLNGSNIKQSLTAYHQQLKRYAIISVMVRCLMVVCLLLFFTAPIIFHPDKIWLLAVVVIIVIIQLILLSGIWNRRLRKIRGTIRSLQELPK
jgi:uncharacterized membrane protein